MTLRQIKADDIAGWDSLEDIAASFEKRGLEEQPGLSGENELVLQLTDTEFITIVDAQAGETATDHKPDNRTRRTNLVATNDFENFTFLTRVRSWEGQQHGRIKHQKLEFSKEQFESDEGKKNTVLKKLNAIEYGSADAIRDTLYDTKEVVKEFYEQFEELRTDLVQEVSGIPDDRGDAKGRYVQVILDRMIFLYFIQEKRLLDREPKYLREHHDAKADAGEDVYEEFYHPLFFDYLAEDNQSREFGNLPYLNGGLFSKNPIEEEFPDAKLGGSTERTNELFDDILNFLSDWNWNVDERLDIVDPKNLSPAILGHIFEQTVNQKEMGAYYTPEEITGFMSRRTIHPYLLDQLNKAVDADYDSIDEVFALSEPEAVADEQAAATDGGQLTTQVATEGVKTDHVETLYHDVLTDASVLDPAVGSGAFLLAAQDVLLDVYLQCLEFFEEVDAEGRSFELAGDTRHVLEEIGGGPSATSLYAKRQIILNNLYGVDIDDGAVEICKLRLWLSMVADIEDEPDEVVPLPNIDFNIRQGNSLVGFTELVEVANEDGDVSLSNFGGGTGTGVKEMYDDVIEAVERHQNASSGREATNARKIAETRIESHSEKLNDKLLEQFEEPDKQDITIKTIRGFSPFHWVIEFASVYANGGFDVIIGNPPWEVLKADSDDFFPRYDERFRTRSPDSKKDTKKDLLQQDDIAKEWEKYQKQMDVRADFFKNSSDFNLQSPDVSGRGSGGEVELSALFLERSFDLIGDHSRVGLLLPGIIFSGKLGKDLRMDLLNNRTLDVMPTFENRGIFTDIDNRYKFGIVIFKNSGKTENVVTIHRSGTVDFLQSIDDIGATISRLVLEQYSPKARLFPYISSVQEGQVLEKILSHPPIGEAEDNPYYANPFRELDHNNDSQYFLESESEGEYPILGGGNVFQYQHDNAFLDNLKEYQLWSVFEDTNKQKSARQRVREKKAKNLKKAIYDSMGGTGSQKSFVDNLLNEERGEPLSPDDVLLDADHCRIGFRQIARSTDERTLIASLLPPNHMCDTTLQPIQLYEPKPERSDLSESPLHPAYDRIFSDREMLAMLGLLNSMPFDFLMRIKVDVTVVMYKFKESQMPRLTDGDDWFHYISDRVARLNCYGEEFAEMRDRLGGVDVATDDAERRTVQAEIDAAAFHAYGLERDDAAFVLDDFHRVSNPRVMTEEYFDAVLEKYGELAEEGPYE
ncbi:type II restriction endonuclease subunit M [Halorubrum ezzemoulense]|uniref:Eco57I restriction-modification methylase domain-containing protein n=1 Tax=Halorubrum ezzemoulense TaxID=337243 RepID=UPI00232BDDED|nr:DNA methyltransferase [Halorubrum ezzemoulense]MDB2269521.1 type II restriction endonuclease subunit M [Halorubrum ezzemoulense]